MKLPAGSQLAVHWACLGNGHQGDNYLAELTLANYAAHALPASGWALYFNTCRKLKPETIADNVQVEQVNGDLWRLSPLPGFAPIAPGEARRFAYEGLFWTIARTDAPLGFYIVYDDGTPEARAEVIGDPQIAPFDSAAKRQRKAGDAVPLSTAETTFDDNAGLSLLPADSLCPLLPTPLSYQLLAGEFIIDAATLIVHDDALASEAALLQSALRDVSGHSLQRAAFCPAGRQAIHLALGEVAIRDTLSPQEAYRLSVTPDAVRITGASAAAVFLAIQSLRQLLPVAAFLNPQSRLRLAACEISDAPRFAYRGLMLDVGRHFSGKDTVLRLIECMALYKLNRLHLHLSEDEGWRLEIPALPELTEIGSRRGFSTSEDRLLPSFGSGAADELGTGSGYYSRADFIEILRYATARHIEVIPEINTPGHARAAIVAMKARHARLLAEGKVAEAEEYLLSDLADASQYESVQLWHDNVICIARESYYRFVDTVLREIRAMYDEAGAPLTTLHTGGDEVPAGAWEGSPQAQTFMREHGMATIQDLQNYALARLRDILKRHGLVFAGWEEIALEKVTVDGVSHHGPNPAFVNAGLQPYVWNNVWGWGQEDFAYQLANAGYKTVLANVTNLYFDLAYNKDPDEPGYYWGGFIETRLAYEFCPLDIYTTATVDLWGQPLDKAKLAAKARLTPEGVNNIIGLQGELWAENIRNRERLEYLAMPRLTALAERAWARDPGWTQIADAAARQTRMDADWNQFANRLGQRELPRLDGLLGGYGYRIPLPGVKRIDGVWHANLSTPGLAIRYSTDGFEPTPASPLYSSPLRLDGPVQFAAFSSSNRRSRVVSVG